MKDVKAKVASGVEIIHATSDHIHLAEGLNRSLKMVTSTNEEEERMNGFICILLSFLLFRRGLKILGKTINK